MKTLSGINYNLSVILALRLRQGALSDRQRAARSGASAQTCVLAEGKLFVAEQGCNAACWDSVASHLSLLPGIICLTVPRNGKDWIRHFAQLDCMNVSRNATEKNCLLGELFMVRDGLGGVASC